MTSNATADVLVEALPYIRQFMGKIVVVKFGGNAFFDNDDEDGEQEALASFASDVVLLHSVGLLPVVVHGGGPQIGNLLSRLGISTEFIDGHRVTDKETLDVARMVLVGKVNRDIVTHVNMHGPLAVGVSGEDANLITATQRTESLGFVGDVNSVDPTLILSLLREGLIPVIATIGASLEGQAYNINSDLVAGALAERLGAEKLIFLSDVEGLRADAENKESLIRQITAKALMEMIEAGAVSGGMIPKAQAAAKFVEGGTSRAHLLDGRVPHVLLVELFTNSGIGTMVLPS